MTPPLTDRDAAIVSVLERVPDAILIEFANLLLTFEANKANGSGALYFNAGHGQALGWGVKSEVTVHHPLTRVLRKAQNP